MPVILRGGAWTARHIRNNCLRQHCHVLATTFRKKDLASSKAVCARIFIVLETRSRILTHIHPNELAVVAGVVRLGAYESQWLRQPEDWTPEPDADACAQWAGLLRHLLARYPVPSFLDTAWEMAGALVHFERDCWCALAYGRSLREVSGFPPSLSNRVLHAALMGGQGSSLVKALWMAQLRCLNAPPLLEKAVLSSRVSNELSDHALWVRLVAKFVAGDESLAAQFALVADTLVAMRAHRNSAQVERVLGLPLAVLIRHCIRFVAHLLQANGHLLTDAEVMAAAAKNELRSLATTHWPPLLGSEPYACNNSRAQGHVSWSVEELCSFAALKKEGLALGHCVGRYGYRCRQGTSAIFSVRHHRSSDEGTTETTSCATIEVRRRTLKIVQIKAFKNRPANNKIMTFIHEWSLAKGVEGVK
ncbi:MAG: hypothetical protein JWO08_1857 [Verrucomicrobiaceae bacterium]|nr:hypothetical protein [Verrucomicrobiaceae bacterium]